MILQNEMRIAEDYNYLGFLPGVLALDCCDLGTATLRSGEQAYITWGRNLDPEKHYDSRQVGGFRPILCGKYCELIIPDDIASELLPVVVKPEG